MFKHSHFAAQVGKRAMDSRPGSKKRLKTYRLLNLRQTWQR